MSTSSSTEQQQEVQTEFVKSSINPPPFTTTTTTTTVVTTSSNNNIKGPPAYKIFLKGLFVIFIIGIVFYVIFSRLQNIKKNKDLLSKTDIKTFISKTGIIKVALGFFISTQVLIFINELINSFVSPIIAFILDKRKNIKELRLKIFGIQFEYGNLIVALIRLMFVLLLVYLLYFFITVNGYEIYSN